MNPINLKELYGLKYKILYDESSNFIRSLKKDPWYFNIPCRYGIIYPYSDIKLAYLCTGKKIFTALHKKHAEIEVVNFSDFGEAIFLFKIEQFNIIAEYAKPCNKRTLSKDHKQSLCRAGTEALKKYRNSTLIANNSLQT